MPVGSALYQRTDVKHVTHNAGRSKHGNQEGLHAEITPKLMLLIAPRRAVCLLTKANQRHCVALQMVQRRPQCGAYTACLPQGLNSA